MNFKCAFEKLYKERVEDNELDDPFFLYCRLSDLCGGTYEDKKKVLLYYKINKQLNIYYSIRVGGKSAVKELIKSYNLISDLLSLENFEKILLMTFSITRGNENKQSSSLVVKAIAPVKVEELEETRTPLTNEYACSSIDVKKIFFWITFSLLGLGIITGIVLMIIFGKHWSWTIWQWIIGIGGGSILALATCGLIYFLEDNYLVEYFFSSTIWMGILIITNFILALIFRNNYKIIFYILSSLILISDIALCIASFHEYEDGWGIIQIVEIILEVLFILVIGNWLSWTVWQWIIGIGGGSVLALISCGLIYFLDDEFLIEYYCSGTILIGILIIINFILMLIFRNDYKIIFYILSSLILIGDIALCIASFVEWEEDWGIAQIVEIIIQIGLIVSAAIWL